MADVPEAELVACNVDIAMKLASSETNSTMPSLVTDGIHNRDDAGGTVISGLFDANEGLGADKRSNARPW